MPLVFSSLDSDEETSTDNTMTSAILSPPLNAVLIVTTIGTHASTISESINGDVSGLGGTWTELDPTDGLRYASRRLMKVYVGTKATAWGTGPLTITTSNGATQDMAYVIDQVTGANTTTPTDTPTTNSGTGTVTMGDVGTVDAGDAVYVAGGHESAGNSFACTGFTGISTLDSMSNVRQIKTFYDDTSPDESPSLTQSSGSANTGGFAFVVNVGAGTPSAAMTGTAITDGVLESEIVAGGETIIITLTDDTWAAAGTGPIGSTADTQALIDGLNAATSPTNGWNNEVRDKEPTTVVTRDSDTQATILLTTAAAGYDVTADETITLTIPAAVLVTSAIDVEADATFDVTNEGSQSPVPTIMSIMNQFEGGSIQ